MAMDGVDVAPLELEAVQGQQPDAGAQKLASAFRKKKKKSAPVVPQNGGY